MTPPVYICLPKGYLPGLSSVPAGKTSVYAAGHMHHRNGMHMPMSYAGPAAVADLDL